MDFNITKKRINNKGFTVVELIVIIGIIAVISALVIGAVASLMNDNAENEQNARSMYYSMQNLMSNVKLSAALPKNADGGIKLDYQEASATWKIFDTVDMYKNYYFEIKVKDCAIDEFRFMICESSALETALGYSGGGGDYGDYDGSFYSQSSKRNTNEENDRIWENLKERIAPFVADDGSEGEWYYFIVVDSQYRVSKVYYSRASFSNLLGKAFGSDGFIDDIGKVGTFPLDFSKKDQTVSG